MMNFHTVVKRLGGTCPSLARARKVFQPDCYRLVVLADTGNKRTRLRRQRKITGSWIVDAAERQQRKALRRLHIMRQKQKYR